MRNVKYAVVMSQEEGGAEQSGKGGEGGEAALPSDASPSEPSPPEEQLSASSEIPLSNEPLYLSLVLHRRCCIFRTRSAEERREPLLVQTLLEAGPLFADDVDVVREHRSETEDIFQHGASFAREDESESESRLSERRKTRNARELGRPR